MNDRAPVEVERRLTALEVTGFKSVANTTRVNLRDVTLLAGANSTGKSTIMQPLLLIKQTIEKPFNPGGLAIDGPLIHYTSADQFLARIGTKSQADEFRVAFRRGSARFELTYRKTALVPIAVSEMAFSYDDQNFSWRNGQIITMSDLENMRNRPIRLEVILAYAKQEKIRNPLQVREERGTLVLGFLDQDENNIQRFERIWSPASPVIDDVVNLIYLPGLRGNPERNYVINAAGPPYPGSFNDYVASMIHIWVGTEDKRLKILEHNLESLGLTSHVTTRPLDDTRVEIHVGRRPVGVRGGARDTVNIADVGFGVSQTLPVLVALLAAAPGQIVFVEQPELHLHPRAQVALADVILQASERGVRLIIETHSSLLILALQKAVAEGRITPDRLSLNWFTRDKTGQTHVIVADVAKDGSYGDWPVDFDDVEFDLQNGYLDLTDRLRAES